MQFLFIILEWAQIALHIITPAIPVHTNTFSTPQRSIQPGYTLQGATGDQCTIASSVYCQVLIYGWVKRSTFRVQILPGDTRYRRLSERWDSNPRSRGWESSALTIRPTALRPKLNSVSLQCNRYIENTALLNVTGIIGTGNQQYVRV